MPETNEESIGRHKIPIEDRKRFAKLVRALYQLCQAHARLKNVRFNKMDFADALHVSISWVSRATRGDYGPWTRSVLDNHLKNLIEQDDISSDAAEKFLTEFGLVVWNDDGKQLIYLHPVVAILEEASHTPIIETLVKRSTKHTKPLTVERPEAVEIYKELERGKRFVLVVGYQASGKTVMINQAVLRLKSNYSVYFLQIRDVTSASMPEIAKEIKRVDNRKTVLVIEDAHVNPQVVDAFLEGFRDMSINCIITARPSYKDQFLWEQRNLLAQIENGKLGHCVRIDISSTGFQSLMEKIITNYYAALQRTLSQAVIQDLIDQSGRDLWALTFLLLASSHGEVDWGAVYRKFHDRFISLGREKDDAVEALLTIAAFWQYELPVAGDFLSSALGINKDAVRFLSDRGYVALNLDKDQYSLDHASVAKHYVQTARAFPYLWGSLLKRFGFSFSEDKLFGMYLQYDSRRCYEVFRHIRYFPALTDALLCNAHARELVVSYIHKTEEPLSSTADLISDIALFGSHEVRGFLLNDLKVDVLGRKMDTTQDVGAVAYFIESLPWDRKPSWTNLVDAVNRSGIVVGANSRDLKDQRLVYCPFTLRFNNKAAILGEISRLIASEVVPSNLADTCEHLIFDAQLCCKSGDVPTICAKSMFHTPSKLDINIVRNMGQKELTAKLALPNTTAMQAAKLLSVIAWTDRSAFDQLIKTRGVTILINKLGQTDIEVQRNLLLWTLQHASPLYFEELVWNSLDDHIKNAYRNTGWMQ